MAKPQQLNWLDNIPQMVRKIREKLGVNVKQFAKIVGVHRTYISMLESGRRTPSMAVLRRIQEASKKAGAKKKRG